MLGDTDSRAHIQEFQEKLTVPLYHSALRPANVPAHLQKRRIQLLREQLPFLTRVARWLTCKHIHVLEEHTCCLCDQATPEDWEHFKICPLHTGRDTLVGCSPAETLRRHEGWPTHKHAHQATEHLFSNIPDQESHHERAGDTGPTPTPRQTHGKPDGGSSAHPARSSPQSNGQDGTPQTPPVDTRNNSPTPPPGSTCSISSITMPCTTH